MSTWQFDGSLSSEPRSPNGYTGVASWLHRGSQSWPRLFQQGRPRSAATPEKAVLFLMEATSSCTEVLIADRKSQHRSQSAHFHNKTNVFLSAVYLWLKNVNSEGICSSLPLVSNKIICIKTSFCSLCWNICSTSFSIQK